MSATTADDRVNMVPLIDCMFFLILFFMIVMRFAPDEKALASMLANQGPAATPGPPIPFGPIVIAIHPAGLERGLQPSDYERAYVAQVRDGSFDRAVSIRVGGSAPLRVEGGALSEPTHGSPAMRATIAAVHQHIARELAAREIAGRSRGEQPEILVRCFSGQSWKYAVLAYDAVRAYEALAGGAGVPSTPEQLAAARPVSFAAPLMRNVPTRELGNELYEIVHAK